MLLFFLPPHFIINKKTKKNDHHTHILLFFWGAGAVRQRIIAGVELIVFESLGMDLVVIKAIDRHHVPRLNKCTGKIESPRFISLGVA